MNPYHSFVSAFAELVKSGKTLSPGNVPVKRQAAPKANAPEAIIFPPHPDDECLMGGLPLRLMLESGMRIIVVPVTLGSKVERRPARLDELKNACDRLGFELELPTPGGLEKINLQSRTNDPGHWAAVVKVMASIIARHQPRAVFFPHESDANTTHIGAHFLLMDALKTMPAGFQCLTVETEFWAPMASPNLMVESSVEDTAELVAALSFHIGEVQRNPFHLRMPAWLMDNVRRGAELIGGQGSAAPDFTFATLYRLRRWKSGRHEDAFAGGRQVSAKQSVSEIGF